MNEIEFRRLDLPIHLVEPQIKGLIVGGGMLSSEVLNQWSARRIWTGAQPAVDVEELADVTSGGLGGPSRLNPLVVSFITRFLEQDRSRIALFEDAVARAGDAVLARARCPYVLVADQVFPILIGGHQREDAVTNLLLDAWSWRLIGVLTRCPEPPTNHHIAESLADLVAHSQHMIVGAWDGEGLLVVDRQVSGHS